MENTLQLIFVMLHVSKLNFRFEHDNNPRPFETLLQSIEQAYPVASNFQQFYSCA